MTSIIPQPDHRMGAVMFIAERTQARRAQQEVSSGPHFEPEPAGGEDAQEVPAREQQHVPPGRAHPLHHPVGTGADLFRRFPPRAAVTEQVPARSRRTNLGGAEALVLAVIPFDQVAIDLGPGPEAGQLAGPGRTPQRTGEDRGERQPFQALAEAAGVALAALGQRQVGPPRMLAREAPDGFAVPGQVNDGKWLIHDSVPFAGVGYRTAISLASSGSSVAFRTTS